LETERARARALAGVQARGPTGASTGALITDEKELAEVADLSAEAAAKEAPPAEEATAADEAAPATPEAETPAASEAEPAKPRRKAAPRRRKTPAVVEPEGEATGSVEAAPQGEADQPEEGER
jgi:hypothetical protein